MLQADNYNITSVVIAGAGGFGTEIYDYLVADNELVVAGFIDDTPGISSPEGTNVPFLGPIDDFTPETGQVVIVAIGSVTGRQAVLSLLWKKDILTPAFVAPGALVSPSATLARGVIVCPFSIINHKATLSEGVAVNVHCSVGHGASIGAFTILSPYAALNGNATVGNKCFLGTRATIYPRVHIGDECVVDSHTGVRMDAGHKKIISSRGQYIVNELRKL